MRDLALHSTVDIRLLAMKYKRDAENVSFLQLSISSYLTEWRFLFTKQISGEIPFFYIAGDLGLHKSKHKFVCIPESEKLQGDPIVIAVSLLVAINQNPVYSHVWQSWCLQALQRSGFRQDDVQEDEFNRNLKKRRGVHQSDQTDV